MHQAEAFCSPPSGPIGSWIDRNFDMLLGHLYISQSVVCFSLMFVYVSSYSLLFFIVFILQLYSFKFCLLLCSLIIFLFVFVFVSLFICGLILH